MKTFLDTSVLVAASDSDHPHHAPSLKYHVAADPTSAACAGHTLAEMYAVLSRLPGGKRQRPEMACLLVRQIIERLTIVVLAAEDYVAAIARCADAGHAGGKVYDALILECARKVQADRIVTWNTRHFRGIAPDIAVKIMEP